MHRVHSSPIISIGICEVGWLEYQERAPSAERRKKVEPTITLYFYTTGLHHLPIIFNQGGWITTSCICNL